jgi:hypothetical protein
MKNLLSKALEMIPKLREQQLKIYRAKMQVRVLLPAKNAKSYHAKLRPFFDTVELDDLDNLEMVRL